MTNAKLMHLRIRVIALENMMITLLTEGSERQLEIPEKWQAIFFRAQASPSTHLPLKRRIK